METVFEVLLTLILVLLTQAALATMVHVINKTKHYPKTIKDYIKYLFIFYVLFNLKKLRTN